MLVPDRDEPTTKIGLLISSCISAFFGDHVDPWQLAPSAPERFRQRLSGWDGLIKTSWRHVKHVSFQAAPIRSHVVFLPSPLLHSGGDRIQTKLVDCGVGNPRDFHPRGFAALRHELSPHPTRLKDGPPPEQDHLSPVKLRSVVRNRWGSDSRLSSGLRQFYRHFYRLLRTNVSLLQLQQAPAPKPATAANFLDAHR
jgi:hypothetical protein